MKERLIGAVVLVGIGAWLIPWVLDGPPQTDTPEPASLELPVPDDPLPLRTQTIRLDDRGSDTPEPRPTLPVPRDSDSDTRQAVAPSTPPDIAVEPPSATVSDEVSAAVEPSPRDTSDSAPSAIAAPSEAQPTQPAETPEPEPRETRTAAAPAAAGDWVVQLGSFGEEQNARRLAERVSAQGYSPDITNVRAGGRLMHRVRVGPYETRASAQEAASALTAQGFVAQVVSAD